MEKTENNTSGKEALLGETGKLDKAQEEVKSSAPKKDNPTLGVIYFLIAGISFAFNFIFAKIIYESKPQTTPIQVLAYRSIISTGIMILKVNRNLKYVVWDSIESD